MENFTDLLQDNLTNLSDGTQTNHHMTATIRAKSHLKYAIGFITNQVLITCCNNIGNSRQPAVIYGIVKRR